VSEDLYRSAADRLRADIAGAEDEGRELRRQLAVVGDRLVGLRRSLFALSRLLGDPDPARPGPDWTADAGPVRASPSRYGDYAERALREAGAPLRIPAMLDRMAEMGCDFGGMPRHSQFSSVASAIKRRPRVFAKVGRGLYGLAEWGADGGGTDGEADR
jgi:hypothetical protein